MLSNEYENPYQNETDEQRKKRLAAAGGATGGAQATPYQYQPPTDGAGAPGPAEAAPNYITTTAPAPTTAVAAPPPVGGPDPVSSFQTTSPRWQDADRSNLNALVRVGDDPSTWSYMPLGAALQQNGVAGIYNGDQGYFQGDPNLIATQMQRMNEAYAAGNPFLNPDGTQGAPLPGTSPGEGYQMAATLPAPGTQVYPSTNASAGAGASPAASGGMNDVILPFLQQYFAQGQGAAPMTPTGPSGYAATSFGPGQDLRGTQVAPQASDRLRSMQADSDNAFRAVSSFDRKASYGGYADDLSARLGSAAQGPAWQRLQTPNRGDIARQRLAAFDTEAAPAIQQQIRAVGQRASALGRLGMGQTEVETLEPYTNYLSKRAALSNQLAADTAEGEIGDARYERDQELALNERNANRTYDARQRALELAMGLAGQDEQSLFGRYTAAQGRATQQAGQEASERGELRGERSFQQGMAQAAEDSAYRQRQQEQAELAAQFARAMGLANLGYAGNPYGTFLAGSQQQGRNADQSFDALAQALAPFLQGSRRAA